MARARAAAEQTAAPAPDRIRFVLTETAVRRIRAAEERVGDLRERLHREAPAWIVCELAEAWLSLVEACNEIAKCNVENAAS